MHRSFKTTCASCGKTLFVSRTQKERMESRGHPPLCFECRDRDLVPLKVKDLYEFKMQFVGSGEFDFQQKLPIEALTGV